eukprot:m.64709 g.64709  ORF g.64709 m.64709 type:complete len:723 (+) comp13942_c0_seq1:269-2437(+)
MSLRFVRGSASDLELPCTVHEEGETETDEFTTAAVRTISQSPAPLVDGSVPEANLDLLEVARRMSEGIELRPFEVKQAKKAQVYKRCFLGEDAINWLIRMMKEDGQEISVSDAILLANSMINAGLFHCVIDKRMMDPDAWYRFCPGVDPQAWETEAATAKPSFKPFKLGMMTQNDRRPSVLLGKRLTKVHNFRCLSLANLNVHKGRVFRSATPAAAKNNDVRMLIETLGIRTIIDLRHKNEAQDDEGDRSLLEYYNEAEDVDLKEAEEMDAAMRELYTWSVDAAKQTGKMKEKEKEKEKEEKRLMRSKSERKPRTLSASTHSESVNQQALPRTSSAGRASPSFYASGSSGHVSLTAGTGGGPSSQRSSSSSVGLAQSSDDLRRSPESVASISAVLAEVERWQFEDLDADDELASATSAVSVTVSPSTTGPAAGGSASSSRSESARPASAASQGGSSASASASASGGRAESARAPAVRIAGPTASTVSTVSMSGVADVQTESDCIRRLDEAKAPVGQEGIVVSDPLQFNKPRLFRLPLAPKATMAKALWAETPKAERFKLVSLFLTGQVREGKRKMLGVMNTLGLSGLNQIILSRSGAQLCRALKIVADRRNHPIMIHCSHGKDRTGLVVSLVLATVGTSHEAIREDYCQSAKHGQSEAGKLRMKQINPDLDIEHFTSAPPEVVDKTFAFIKKKWGTLENYLDSIGFTEDWRRALKAALCVKP